MPPNVLSAATSPDYMQNKIERTAYTEKPTKHHEQRTQLGYATENPQRRICQLHVMSLMENGWCCAGRPSAYRARAPGGISAVCIVLAMICSGICFIMSGASGGDPGRNGRQQCHIIQCYHSCRISSSCPDHVRSECRQQIQMDKFHHLCVVYSDDLGCVYDVRWQLRRPSRQE